MAKKPITVVGVVVYPDGSEKLFDDLTLQERRDLAFYMNKVNAEQQGFRAIRGGRQADRTAQAEAVAQCSPTTTG